MRSLLRTLIGASKEWRNGDNHFLPYLPFRWRTAKELYPVAPASFVCFSIFERPHNLYVNGCTWRQLNNLKRWLVRK